MPTSRGAAGYRKNAEGKLEAVHIPTEALSPANAERVAQHGLPPNTQSINRQSWEDANNSLWGYKNRRQELERDLHFAEAAVTRVTRTLAEIDHMIEVWTSEVQRLEV